VIVPHRNSLGAPVSRAEYKFSTRAEQK
jgi:hypothetical protein